jgi:hypothetical protein
VKQLKWDESGWHFVEDASRGGPLTVQVTGCRCLQLNDDARGSPAAGGGVCAVRVCAGRPQLLLLAVIDEVGRLAARAVGSRVTRSHSLSCPAPAWSTTRLQRR